MTSASPISKETFIGSMAPNTLVVKNLSRDVTKNDLEKLFSKEGRLDSVGLYSSNRGIIEFCSSNHAKEAMYKLNKTKLKGKRMIITWCEKQCPCSNAKLSVLINGPPINKDNFKAFWSDFGAVSYIEKVLQHRGISYEIVQFDSETSATNAIKFYDGAEIDDKKILVSKYNDCKDLCVKYHPKDLDENDILRAFTMYGVCTVNVEKDKNCKPSGIGFVSYHTSEEAKEALRNLNGAYLGSHRLYVRGIVIQAATEDNNPEEVPIFVTKDNNLEEAPIFVIEDNRRQLVTTVNMEGFRTTSDFLQFLNKLGDDHKHIGLLERISLDGPWPGYEAVYKHVDNNNEVVIKPFEDVEPCFNEDPFEHSELWFLGMVNKIEFYEKKAVPLLNLNA